MQAREVGGGLALSMECVNVFPRVTGTASSTPKMQRRAHQQESEMGDIGGAGAHKVDGRLAQVIECVNVLLSVACTARSTPARHTQLGT
jgi:hypothetical protein